jgi:hypothetical protein
MMTVQDGKATEPMRATMPVMQKDRGAGEHRHGRQDEKAATLTWRDKWIDRLLHSLLSGSSEEPNQKSKGRVPSWRSN